MHTPASASIGSTVASGLASLFVLAGCLFQTQPIRVHVIDPGYAPGEVRLLAEDSILTGSGPVDQKADWVLPILDPSLPVDSSPVHWMPAIRVKRHESGEIWEYRIGRQHFRVWNEYLERRWNLHELRVWHLPAYVDSSGTRVDSIPVLYSRAGDLYTRYVDSMQSSTTLDGYTTTAHPATIGILLGLDESGDTITIKMVAPDSPAERAGLIRGSRILRVDGEDVTGDSALPRFRKLTEGGPGTRFQMTFTVGEQVREALLIKADQVLFPTVAADSIAEVGYILLAGFKASSLAGSSTKNEFVEALQATSNFPVTLIDVRGNPGGSIGEVLAACDALLDGGTIILESSREPNKYGIPIERQRALLAKQGGLPNRKFVLLADSGSASAAEILVASLRDNLGSPLVGTKTFGKGIGQRIFQTPAGGLAIITTLRFQTPLGKEYHAQGLEPDYPAKGEFAALDSAVAVAQSLMTVPLAKRSSVSRRSSGYEKQKQLLQLNARELRLYPDKPIP